MACCCWVFQRSPRWTRCPQTALFQIFTDTLQSLCPVLHFSLLQVQRETSTVPLHPHTCSKWNNGNDSFSTRLYDRIMSGSYWHQIFLFVRAKAILAHDGDDGTFTWQSSWLMMIRILIRILTFIWWTSGAPALLYNWVMTQMADYTAAVRNLHLPLTELIRPIHKLKAQWRWTYGFHCKRNARVTHQHDN